MTDSPTDPAAPAPPAFLDWRGKEHVGARLAKCRVCGGQTLLRDDNGKACHKTCAETEAADRAAAVARRTQQVAEQYGTAGGSA
jgi:hypothetical protein